MNMAPGWTLGLLDYYKGYASDISPQLILGWISQESGGRIGETTSLDERGYFQIHPDESKQFGFDHERLSTDPEYSFSAGVELVRRYMQKAADLGFDAASDLGQHITKFLHSMGAGAVKKLLDDMRAHGVEPSSWEVIEDYAKNERDRLFSYLKHDPVKWTGNVDGVFTKGALLATLANFPNPTVTLPLIGVGIAALLIWLLVRKR